MGPTNQEMQYQTSPHHSPNRDSRASGQRSKCPRRPNLPVHPTPISQSASFLLPARPAAASLAHKLLSYLGTPIPWQRVIPQALMRPRNRLLRMISMGAHARRDGGHKDEEGGWRVHGDEINRLD